MRTDWTAYRLERLGKVLAVIKPELLAVEAMIFEEIEIAEVNEVLQRFRDFKSELKGIEAKYGIGGQSG